MFRRVCVLFRLVHHVVVGQSDYRLLYEEFRILFRMYTCRVSAVFLPLCRFYGPFELEIVEVRGCARHFGVFRVPFDDPIFSPAYPFMPM